MAIGRDCEGEIARERFIENTEYGPAEYGNMVQGTRYKPGRLIGRGGTDQTSLRKESSLARTSQVRLKPVQQGRAGGSQIP